MAGTILPMGHGKRSFNRIPVPLTAHTLGCLAGGAGVGGLGAWTVILVVGEPGNDSGLPAGGLFLLSLSCCLYGLDAAKLLRVYKPQSKWQVPVRWTGWPSHSLAALAYGLLLGVGFLTRMPSLLYPVFLWTAMTATPVCGAVAMSTFGAFRVLPLWFIEFGCRSGSQREHIVAGLGYWQPAMTMAGAYALVFASGMLVSTILYK